MRSVSHLLTMTKLDYCKEMMEKAEKLGKKLLLPVDTYHRAISLTQFDATIATSMCDADKMDASKEGLDIGPKTSELYCRGC